MVGVYRLKEFGARLEAGSHVLPAAAFAAVEEATRLVAAAETRAAALAEGAQRVYDEEKVRGYQDGRRDAALAAAERLFAERHDLDLALRAIESDLAHVVESCVRKLVLGVDVAERAEAAVRQALAKMRREKRVELRAPPVSFAHLRASVDRIRADFPEVELIDVVEDDALGLDRIVVETGLGRVDADLGRSLDELGVLVRRALETARGDEPSAGDRSGASHG